MVKGVRSSLNDPPGAPERSSCHSIAKEKIHYLLDTLIDFGGKAFIHLLIYVRFSFRFKDGKINKVISNILLWILDATGTDVQIKQVFNATQKGFKRQAWCQRVPAEVVPSNYLHFV